MRAALIVSLFCCVALASIARESRSSLAWRQMEDAAYAFQRYYGRFPRDIAELRSFSAARHLPFPIAEFVRLRLRHIDAQQSSLEGETKPPESNSEGRRLIVTH